MSVHVLLQVNLHCDQCRMSYGTALNMPRESTDEQLERAAEAVRAKARQSHWERFRPRLTDPNGDYCSECSAWLRRDGNHPSARM
jgi:hypothetical protein